MYILCIFKIIQWNKQIILLIWVLLALCVWCNLKGDLLIKSFLSVAKYLYDYVIFVCNPLISTYHTICLKLWDFDTLNTSLILPMYKKEWSHFFLNLFQKEWRLSFYSNILISTFYVTCLRPKLKGTFDITLI